MHKRLVRTLRLVEKSYRIRINQSSLVGLDALNETAKPYDFCLADPRLFQVVQSGTENLNNMFSAWEVMRNSKREVVVVNIVFR